MLPQSRNRTYTGANAIVPGDLDDIQDCIIDSKHDDRVLNLSGWACQAVGSGGAVGNYTITPVRAFQSGAGACSFFLSLPFKQGDRIKSITYAIRGSAGATGDLTACDVIKTTADGSDTSIGTDSAANLANAWADRTINVTDTTIAAGESVSIFWATNETGMAIGNIRVTYDRP